MDDSLSAQRPPAALLARLQACRQEHLIAHWATLTPAERQQLVTQINAIDFTSLQQQFAKKHLSGEGAALGMRAARAKSPEAIVMNATDNRFTAADARARGEAALRAGKVGMILVAGGQGTRLGFEHPKGLFPIGPLSQRSLFEILIDRLRAVSTRYGTRIPLFIMTSPATTAETRAFLAQHQNFGLADEDLFYFEQGTLPAVDAETGKILLAARGEIATAPDGHGGMLAALAKHVGFEALQRRGIDLLFYGQIDNPLLTVCDPEFLGYHLLAGSELTTQVVRKVLPEERVGVVVQIDGHLEIMEYSDLSPADAARRRDDGTLELWAGNTAVHAFDVAFLQAASQSANVTLPLHLATKKVPFVDPQGTLIEPTEPNAIKFERFIFDLLRLAKWALVVEVDRAVAFAPVKNAAGAVSDTAEIAQAAMLALDRALLSAAGVQVSPGVRVEINPNFALDAEDLARRLPPGTRINQDTYLL